ncbi:MAG: hypothetical protein Q9192_003611 [Flavoplaca navasiana]
MLELSIQHNTAASISSALGKQPFLLFHRTGGIVITTPESLALRSGAQVWNASEALRGSESPSMTDPGPIFDRLGLAQYLERFIDEGFETWETVLDITESDLYDHRLQREIANATGIDIRNNAVAGPDTLQTQPGISLDPAASSDRQGPPTLEGTKPGKRKYRRHPKTDEYAPERPQSAYVIFSNKVRDELKSENLSFTEIAKRVGERWQTLSPEEREPFEAKAASAKEAYLAELTRYKKTDQFKEHAAYLADFKAKHSSEGEMVNSSVDLDGKRPRLEIQPGLGRNDSLGSQDASPEPALISSVPRRVDDTSSSVHHSHGRSSPQLRYSPTTSLSSPALSGRGEKSNSPSVPPNPRQLPYTSWERESAKRPEPLPPITSFEPRESPATRGSSAWFDNHLGTTLNNTSPLSNYRRSFHPPALFVQNDSTSSSKSSNSTSQSSDPSDNSIFANGHREEASSRRQPPTLLRGLDTPTMPPTQAADLKPRIPILPQPPGTFSLAQKPPF